MNAAAALDRTDLRLLALLQRDGRASNADLATQVNLSPSACLRRIQRLESAGVVAGYAARLDPQALGLGLQAFVRCNWKNTVRRGSSASCAQCRTGTKWWPAMP